MTAEPRFTEAEAHLRFAKQYNLMTWELVDQPSRTRDDEERMLDYAHASLAHWRVVGSAVNHQRGEWMISRVHVLRDERDSALRHAQRCLELTNTHQAEMEDFDLAFAYEAMARAHALNGDRDDAGRFLTLARQAGEKIANDEDRAIFLSELDGGNWYGAR